jgi:hypothetical protein
MSKKGYLAFFAVILVLGGMIYYLNYSADTGSGPAGSQSSKEPPITYTGGVLKRMWPTMERMAASPPLGNPNAKWTAIEVGDFQCPNCGAAKPLVEQSILNSNGAAKLYFINFPIPSMHPHAMIAAEAAESAAAQGKFWPMYDLLYGHQDELIDSQITKYARGIPGLDVNKLEADMSSGKYQETIGEQVSLMNNIELSSVPTLFIQSPKGDITWYCGTEGGDQAPGIGAFAASCPWGGGMGKKAVDAYLAAVKKHQKAEGKTG